MFGHWIPVNDADRVDFLGPEDESGPRIILRQDFKACRQILMHNDSSGGWGILRNNNMRVIIMGLLLNRQSSNIIKLAEEEGTSVTCVGVSIWGVANT